MRPRTSKTTPRASLLVVAALAFGPAAGAQEIPKEGSFDGRWDLVGKAQKIELGDERTVTVVKFEGAIVLTGHQRGLSRGFRTECVGLQDPKTGGLGRCVWKDRFDHEIWSEIESDSVGSTRKSRGRLVGGTGKFEGISGSFEFEWVYMTPASKEGPVRGYATEIAGSWKLP